MTADGIDPTERWTTIRPMTLVVKMVTREPSVAEAAQMYGPRWRRGPATGQRSTTDPPRAERLRRLIHAHPTFGIGGGCCCGV